MILLLIRSAREGPALRPLASSPTRESLRWKRVKEEGGSAPCDLRVHPCGPFFPPISGFTLARAWIFCKRACLYALRLLVAPVHVPVQQKKIEIRPTCASTRTRPFGAHWAQTLTGNSSQMWSAAGGCHSTNDVAYTMSMTGERPDPTATHTSTFACASRRVTYGMCGVQRPFRSVRF
ncbi:hypothetical protein BJV78DRAFT_691678 [Lactifluus subvellereus]|nr:hypothetical protein BJV78DRAFT_691678 [Lactifluus subvellereus]